MRKVLLFTRSNIRIDDAFWEIMNDDPNIKIDIWQYTDLELSIIDGEMFARNSATRQNLSEHSNIFVISTPEHEKNHIFSALGCIARKNQTPMLDNQFANTSGKLYEMCRFAENDLPVPDTFFGKTEFLQKAFREMNQPGVLKATHASKGKDNYLITSLEQLSEILRDNPSTNFILQKFIPNNGDYRVITVNDEPRMVIYRSSNGKDHRNNTSLGGSAQIIPMNEADPQILDLAKRAASSMQIQLAGVDIIQDAKTGNYYLLEINRTPQLISGSFTKEKAKMLHDYLVQQSQSQDRS